MENESKDKEILLREQHLQKQGKAYQEGFYKYFL